MQDPDPPKIIEYGSWIRNKFNLDPDPKQRAEIYGFVLSGAVPGAAAVAALAASAGRPPTAQCADRVATRGAKRALRGGLRGPAPRGARDNDRIAEVIFSFHPSLSFLVWIVTCFLFSVRAKEFKFWLLIRKN